MLDRAFALTASDDGVPHWFDPYADAARRTAAAREPGRPLAAALNAALPWPVPGRALSFVPQAELPEGEAYEAFIARTDRVPTRDHPHDLLNALVWSRFPALKSHLNRHQADEIARLGIGPRRGPVRDALTLFDENAAWLQAPVALVDALRSHDWHTAFVAMRTAWREARLTLFGHALMEKLLLSPHKSITAHVWVVPEAVDAEVHLVASLTSERLARKADFPLPLMGVPGWCVENESADFYDDTSVFRPKRR